MKILEDIYKSSTATTKLHKVSIKITIQDYFSETVHGSLGGDSWKLGAGRSKHLDKWRISK